MRSTSDGVLIQRTRLEENFLLAVISTIQTFKYKYIGVQVGERLRLNLIILSDIVGDPLDTFAIAQEKIGHSILRKTRPSDVD